MVVDARSTYREVLGLDSSARLVLVGEVVELLAQHIGVLDEVDNGVKAVGDTDQVSSEVTAVRVIDLHPLEQVTGLGVALEQPAHPRTPSI